MRKIIRIDAYKIIPDRIDVFRTQGIPEEREVNLKVNDLFMESLRLLKKYSEPEGIISEIKIKDFEQVYMGEGLNENKTPLEEIFPKSDNLALFAVTLGESICIKINDLFNNNDFALGSMLDSTASEGCEKAAFVLEDYFLNYLLEKDLYNGSKGILRYSPGYCGWHMSGQKKLFKYLYPEDIGISLLDSYLMKPLKSVSGVIVAGDRDIHVFDNTYTFCKDCVDKSCRERIKSLHDTVKVNKEGDTK